MGYRAQTSRKFNQSKVLIFHQTGNGLRFVWLYIVSSTENTQQASETSASAAMDNSEHSHDAEPSMNHGEHTHDAEQPMDHSQHSHDARQSIDHSEHSHDKHMHQSSEEPSL